MVYTPKPNIVKRVIDEFVGFVTFVFIARLVVATTGGSTAFATNLLVNALANGAAYAICLAIWPHVFLDLTLLICKFFDDLLLWFLGLGDIILIDFLVYLLMGLAQFLGGLIAALFIWVFIDNDVTNLGLPIVPSGVDSGRAFGGEAILSIVFVFGFFYVSQVYNRLFLQGKMESEKKDIIMDIKSKKPAYFINPAFQEGSDKYVLGAFSRAIVLGLLRFGLAAGGIPITGGLFNIFAYVDLAIVSWSWFDTYYVHVFGPLLGIFGYVFYVVLYYLPKLNLYSVFFGEDAPTPEALSDKIAEATRLGNLGGVTGLVSADKLDFYHRKGAHDPHIQKRRFRNAPQGQRHL